MTRETAGQNIDPGVVQRVVAGLRYAITGKAPDFFGPLQPLPPVAQDAGGVAGRLFDYPTGYNLRITPRSGEAIDFGTLRGLADNYDLLRLVIETCKDKLCSLDFTIEPLDPTKDAEDDGRCCEIMQFLRFPDQEHDWRTWLRMILEDLFVIDAPAIYPRFTNGGQLYALEPIDGATIKRVIDQTGRTPFPPDVAYQQILKGLPAVDYSRDQLIYVPRNLRTSHLYGYSPVEQVMMTVNIAMRRQLYTLNYYTEGNVPEALVSVPSTWVTEQIRQFQQYWDSIIAGNLEARRHMRFIPDGTKFIETKQPPLKDVFDEWLARVVCFAFSVSPQPFVPQMNRATANAAKEAEDKEGLLPFKQWIKSLIDLILTKYLGAPDLQFVWTVADSVAPAERAAVDLTVAQTVQIYAALGLQPPADIRQQAEIPDSYVFEKPTAPVSQDAGQGEKKPPGDVAGAVSLTKKKDLLTIRKVWMDDDDENASMFQKDIEEFFASVASGLAASIADIGVLGDPVSPMLAESFCSHWLETHPINWEPFVEMAEPYIASIGIDASENALTEIGITDEEVFKALRERAVDYAKERAAEMVGLRNGDYGLMPDDEADARIDETTREGLRKLIVRGLEEGQSVDELSAAIVESYAFSPERAKTIAWTEMCIADTQGVLLGWRQSEGLVIGKIWNSHPGCCPMCCDMNGERRALDANFSTGVDGPPNHPRCRCGVTPIMHDEKINDDDADDNGDGVA
jgi:Phage portal protein/Phage Mu protein F like protein